MSGIGLPEVVAGLIVLALNAYAITGGADYGGGLWDLLARGPRREQQRQTIERSLAPIWEANHVWLIVVVVMLFTAFPAAFSTIAIVLHVPITLLLIGIVLRGSSFVFRSYGGGARASRTRWGRTFAIASTVVPLLLGIVIGAISSGDVATAYGRIGSASFADVFISPWLSAFPISVGVFALALFAYLAAVYLALAAIDEPLREDFRRRALVMAVVVLLTAAIALALSFGRAPRVASGVTTAPWSLVLHVATGVMAVATIVALWRRAYRVARVAAAAHVSCILWGWAISQYPFIVPDTLRIGDTAAPSTTLALLVIGVALGAAILIPSLRYLFSMFGGRVESARVEER